MIFKNTLIISFIFLLSINFSYAQKNFLPGEITKKDGSIIKGLIDYKNWNINPKKISFKKNIESKTDIFSTDDINSFKVSGEKYVSAKIQIETSPLNTNNLTKDPSLKFKTVSAFLQTMIGGNKSLYHYKDEVLKNHFYIKQDGNYELLVYKRYIKKHNGVVVKSENNKYKGQLAFYLKEYSDIQSKLENTKYEKKSLEKLFRYYYAYTEDQLSFEKKTEKEKNEIGLIAGVSSTAVNVKSSMLFYSKQPNSKKIALGLYYNIIFPRNNGRWSIYNELLMSSYSTDGSFRGLNYTYLKLNNMVRYSYPIGNKSAFSNIGFSNGIAINDKNSFNNSNVFNLFPTRKYEQGILLGIGIKTKKLSGEIRYERGNGMFKDNPTTSARVERMFLLIGYQF